MAKTGVYLSHEGVAVRAGMGSYTPSAPHNKVKATMRSFECWQMAARGNCWTAVWASSPNSHVMAIKCALLWPTCHLRWQS